MRRKTNKPTIQAKTAAIKALYFNLLWNKMFCLRMPKCFIDPGSKLNVSSSSTSAHHCSFKTWLSLNKRGEKEPLVWFEQHTEMTRWIFFIFPLSLESHVKKKIKKLIQYEPNLIHSSLCSKAIFLSAVCVAGHTWGFQVFPLPCGEQGGFGGNSQQIRARFNFVLSRAFVKPLQLPKDRKFPAHRLCDWISCLGTFICFIQLPC